MNTYIAIRPYIAQQVVEHLKKLPYNEVSGIISEIEYSMNYPVQLNWNQPIEVVEEKEKEEKKEEKRKPIGFRFVEEEEENDGDGGEDPEEPETETIICKKTRKIKK